MKIKTLYNKKQHKVNLVKPAAISEKLRKKIFGQAVSYKALKALDILLFLH